MKLCAFLCPSRGCSFSLAIKLNSHANLKVPLVIVFINIIIMGKGCVNKERVARHLIQKEADIENRILVRGIQ